MDGEHAENKIRTQENEEAEDSPPQAKGHNGERRGGSADTTSTTHTNAEKAVADAADPHDDLEAGKLPKPAQIPALIAVKVGAAERRGLLARFVLLAEVTEPKAYSRSIKWFITFVVAMAAVAAPLASAIIFPALPEISKDLHTDPAITNFSAAFYMLSMSVFPLWWSSFSEIYGRRNIYLISFALFLLFNILSAISVNIAMLIVMRILSGGAAGSVQAVGAGTIADIWEVRERGQAMGMFYLGPLMGPLLAPIFGGALTQGFGWRSTQWFLTIYGVVILAFITFALPETLHTTKPLPPPPPSESTQPAEPTLSRTTTRQSRISQHVSRYSIFFKRALIDPLKIILYLRYPPVLITVYYASITFGSLYLLNISLESTFSAPPYSFSTIIVGLTYIPNSVGYVLASLFGGRWTDTIMARQARRRSSAISATTLPANPTGPNSAAAAPLVYRPEDRMRENAWLAALLYPSALIWYGWTAEHHLPWAIPLVANFFFGLGSMLIFAMATTMLTEFMPSKASAGVALNNFVRNIFSCVGALVAEPLIKAIGNGWLFTAVGLIAAISGLCVVGSMHVKGEKWRARMTRELGLD